jgi:hypothetical protein
MKRKSISIVLGLVALAATLAPAASASPVLTEKGTALAPGAEISATNVGNVVRTSGFGNLTCTGSTWHLKVLANGAAVETGNSIEAEVESAVFTGTETEERCTGFGAERITSKNLPWCLQAGGQLAADTFEIRGGKCSEAAKPITWIMHTAFGECAFSAPKLAGTFTTGESQAHLTIERQEATRETGQFCISAFKWDATYSLETTASPFTPLTIS